MEFHYYSRPGPGLVCGSFSEPLQAQACHLPYVSVPLSVSQSETLVKLMGHSLILLMSVVHFERDQKCALFAIVITNIGLWAYLK